jgi:hypothetical protein
MRVLLNEDDQIGPHEYASWRSRSAFVYLMDYDLMEWFWINAAAFWTDRALVDFRSSLLHYMISHYGSGRGCGSYDQETTRVLVKLVDAKTLLYCFQDEIRLILILFGQCTCSLDSQRTGGAFIDLLVRLGIDAAACVETHMAGLWEDGVDALARNCMFERLEDGTWILGWVWIHDKSAPGYLLTSEHIALGADVETRRAFYWTFLVGKDQAYRRSKKNSQCHSDRLMADKARKERARTGQKRTKSRMPGTYNW